MKREFVYNAPNLKLRRQQLRNNATEAEIFLWKKLRKRQQGFKFVRQYSVSGYVIDLYAPEIRLAIEIDGKHHADQNQKIYDQYRTKYLLAADIKEIRFPNEEILNNINMVINKIRSHLPS